MSSWHIKKNSYGDQNITTGILQGDVLAPYLFILVIDYVMRKPKKKVRQDSPHIHNKQEAYMDSRSMILISQTLL